MPAKRPRRPGSSPVPGSKGRRATVDLALEGMTALVTGGSSGIGWSVVERLAREGANVVPVAHRGARRLDERLATRPWRERALAVTADVTDQRAVESAFEQARRRFGRVDLLVTSAGVWPSEDLRLDRMPVDRLRRTLEVNLLGTLLPVRAFLARLAAVGPRDDGRGASVVLIGSTAGRFGERGHADYAVSKAGLRGLLLTLKNEIVELDPLGRANLVEPGWTRTPMAEPSLGLPGVLERTLQTTALARIARPEDIARPVAFLLSPVAARHVTGEVLTVSGGMEGRVLRAADAVDRARVLGEPPADGDS